MALKGTLKDFSLADIFQLIGIQKKTGVLTLKNEKEVVTVAFVDGNVVSADALHRRLEDRIGTVLVKSGRITEAQLQEALRIQKSTLKRMGNILVENKFIDPTALREALQIQISQMVYRLFRWGNGEYDFTQEERVEYDNLVVPMSAESILMEGARILDEWPMIEKGIRSFSAVFRHANVEIATAAKAGAGVALDEAARAVTLSEEDRKVYQLVDGKRSVQEIVERCPMSEFDTCRIIYELIGRQILEEVRGAGPKAAAAAAAAPAPAVARRRATPRLILAIGYLVLVAAAGGLLVRRAEAIVRGLGRQASVTPYLAPLIAGDEARSIRDSIAWSRMQRIDFAIQVYYLRKRGYPESLARLVTEHLLRPAAILDPLGRPFEYAILPGGYKVSFASGESNTHPIELINAPPA